MRPASWSLKDTILNYSLPTGSGCRLWRKSTDRDGYGLLTWKGRKSRRAHQWSWIAHNGSIPSGLCVCHTCDTPACVEISHLWLGTNADNTADRNRKGRQSRGAAHAASFVGSPLWWANRPKGSGHVNSKINENDVRCIRSDTRPQKEIAKSYGITAASVSLIKRRINWAHVS